MIGHVANQASDCYELILNYMAYGEQNQHYMSHAQVQQRQDLKTELQCKDTKPSGYRHGSNKGFTSGWKRTSRESPQRSVVLDQCKLPTQHVCFPFHNLATTGHVTSSTTMNQDMLTARQLLQIVEQSHELSTKEIR